MNRPNLASIDTTAGKGRSGFSVGDRVRVSGTGRYAGQTGVIERITSGAVPSAVVRVASGEAGQVRTIDLEPSAPQD
jgi:hypothetical protein